MKTSTLKVLLIGVSFLFLHSLQAQQMLNPADTIVTYDSANPPVQPPSGKIGKWVRTVSMSWNSSAYKCYIYGGSDFRLHFPQTYVPGDGKRYPILVFYHGDGEEGPIYDNETQLRNGGLLFHKAEVDGIFDGYIIMMQNQYGWGTAQFINLHNLIDTLCLEYGGDPYRVIQNGLSGGGQGVWQQLVLNPTYFSGSIPMSAALPADATPTDVNILKFTPIWNLDGGQDDDPTPYQAQQVASAFLSAGGNYTYTDFTTLAHNTWDSTWLEPNFWPFVNAAYLSNPWPLYGKTVFCAGDSVKTTLGIVPGLAGYQWRRNGVVIPTATTDSIVVTQSGIYDARAMRAGYGWSNWSPMPVQIVSMAAQPTFTITQPSCGVAKGSITITTPRGTGLEYSIDGVHFYSDTTFYSVAAGTYSITARDSSLGCITPPATAVVNPEPKTPASPTVRIYQPSCNIPLGRVAIANADSGYFYSIHNTTDFLAVDSFTGMGPNIYLVTAKDTADGCISIPTSVTIQSQPLTPGAPTIAVTQPTCTITTGTITILPVAADSGYQYGVDGGKFTPDTVFTGLAPGGHYVIAQNISGCVSTSTTTLIQKPPPKTTPPAVSITQPTCSVTTGTISITSGAGASILYSINDSAYQSGTSFTGLATGSYSITADSTSGCPSSAVTVLLTPAPGAPAAPTVVITQPTCTVAAGTITITPADSGLTYSVNGTTYQSGASFSGLAAGSYQVTAQNSRGCTSSPTTAVVNPQPSAPAAPTLAITQPTCTVATGAIAITSGLAPGYQYSVDGGAYQADTTFPGLAPGSHYITAENSSGCVSSSSTALIQNPPSKTTAPAVSITQPTCTVTTGTISITSGAGTAMTYSINDSAYQAGTSFPGLAPGTYSIMADSISGCPSSAVTAILTPAPGAPAAPTAVIAQPTCTVAAGTITITPADSGLMYSVNGTTYQSGASFSGLAAGSYQVTAQNSRGCTSSPTTAIVNPQPSAPAAPTLAITQPTCIVATGTIAITSGVGPGYQYSVDGGAYQADTTFPGLAPGSHYITAENSPGCISSSSTALIRIQPSKATAPTFSITSPTCTVITGTISITSGAGTAMTYSINDSAYQAGTSFPGLAPGTYSLTADSVSECPSAPVTAIISPAPGAPAVPTVAIVQPSCTVATGTINISGADTGLTYSINGTAYQPGASFSGLTTGSYPVTAENSTGCTSSAKVAIINPQPSTPAAPTISTVQPSCAIPTGMITITSVADTGIYYSINGVNYQSDTTFKNVAAGSYSVTAESGAGCVSPSTAAMIQAIAGAPATPTVAIGQPTCSVATGTITITSPIDTGLLYSMDGTTFLSDTSFSNISPGTYQITVKNGAGCISSSAAALVLTPPLTCSSCTVATHSTFNGFGLSANPGYATTLWFNLHTKLASTQLTVNGDYLLFSGGNLAFTGISSSFDSSVSLPRGEIIADNTVSGPVTSYNSSTNTWVTKVPLGYSSDDLFVSGAAISSANGFTLTGTTNATILSGSWSSDKNFSSSWWYGLACYQPTFSDGSVGSVNAADGTPIGGNATGTPNNQTGGLVTGGSGNGGSNFTGTYSSADDFTACLVPLAVPDKVEITVFPNPYPDEVNFNITTSVSGTGSLEFYNILGEKLAIVVETQFQAGVTQTITVPMTMAHKAAVVYVFRIGSKKVQGTLLPQKL